MGMEELRALYEGYIRQVERLELESKPTDGLFGMGKGVSGDSCHDDFAERLKELLAELEAEEPSSEKLREVLGYIYRMSAENKEPVSAYWTMNAVHGLTAGLIARLEPQDAAALYGTYIADHPRRMRFPVQKQVIKALERAMKA